MSREEAIYLAGQLEDFLHIPSFVCEYLQKDLEEEKYKEVIEYIIQRKNEEVEIQKSKCLEEIERLQKDLTYYQKYSADLLNKNNTFESIINELEKWLEKQQDINDRTNSIIFNARGFEDKQVLNKLQELKDSDKE